MSFGDRLGQTDPLPTPAEGCFHAADESWEERIAQEEGVGLKGDQGDGAAAAGGGSGPRLAGGVPEPTGSLLAGATEVRDHPRSAMKTQDAAARSASITSAASAAVTFVP